MISLTARWRRRRQMPGIIVERLKFEFPNNWEAEKVDDWSFSRKQFQTLGQGVRLACGGCKKQLRCAECDAQFVTGNKVVDIVALRGSVAWLIEVKDYRRNPREKSIQLSDEVAIKVRDSLALLVAAAANANDAGQKTFARRAVGCESLRVILHLEQIDKPSKLFPRDFRPRDVEGKIRRLVKCIDPHAVVADTNDMRRLEWSVTPVLDPT